jgi:hypothetical protein
VLSNVIYKLVVASLISNDIMSQFYKKGEFRMATIDPSSLFIKEFQERFEKKIKENEIAILEHWKSQLDKITNIRPDSIASLQVQIAKMAEMMANRIKMLKKDWNG